MNTLREHQTEQKECNKFDDESITLEGYEDRHNNQLEYILNDDVNVGDE